MTKIIFAIIFLVFARPLAFSQSVGIGTNAPDASSVLELKANNKGFLPPRMTASEKGLIPSPKAGLIIYQTDGVAGLYVYNGSAWAAVSSAASAGSGWLLGGNAGTNAATHFIGTIDNKPLKFRVNNQNAGGIFNTGGNVGIGIYALDSITTGSENAAVGYNALHANKSGTGNAALGTGALFNNSGGNNNVAIGISSLVSNTTADNNIALGAYSLYNNTIGNNNSATGYNALYNNTSGSYNIALGRSAAFNNQTGNNNIAIGTASSMLNESGNNIIAIGDSALYRNTAGNNIAIGARALRSNTTGVSNTALGADAMYNNLSGDQNTAVGRTTLFGNTTGIQNTAIGQLAARYNQTGNGNTAIGFQSLLFNVANNNNTALGHIALAGTIADNNTGIGKSALTANTVGFSNTAVGAEAMATNTTGNYNTAIGYRANTWGNNFTNATAIGANAQAGCSDCVVLGSVNGYNGATSNSKVGIGTTSPQRTLHINPNGSGTILIGQDINSGGYTSLSMGISQASAGYSFIQSVKAAGAANPYGALALNPNGGFVGIGTANPIAALHIKQHTDEVAAINAGLRLERQNNTSHWDMAIDFGSNLSFSFNGVEKFWVDDLDGDITTVSDRRMKKDIQPIETALPLILKLEAKSYRYKDNAPGSRMSYGFIAQEVEQIFPGAVSTNDKDGMKAIAYQKLNILAIKSIQEQQVIIEAQNKRIASLETKMEELLKALHK